MDTFSSENGWKDKSQQRILWFLQLMNEFSGSGDFVTSIYVIPMLEYIMMDSAE